MSGFDYNNFFQGRDNHENEYRWEDDSPEGSYNFRNNNFVSRPTYGEAYGAYRGGYGWDGGYSPHRTRPYQPQGAPLPAPLGFGPIRMGPQRAPMHSAAAFLAQCQVLPEYIRDLPRQLLDLIQPEYCGLCGLHMTSFAVAKVHYNGRNHYKAQKKFMAQLNNPGSLNDNAPLKARHLHCELCDIQITSPAHGNSHYAGRSHLAIVEGRRAPRNPLLVQPSMKARLEQLIRREKNNPLEVSEPERGELEEVVAIPEVINIPPELVCSICKTTMACTEQMNIHLNGRRHLHNEKQFILKMMKGDDNKNDAGRGNANADFAGAADREGDNGDQTAAAAADWGTGSEGDQWEADN